MSAHTVHHEVTGQAKDREARLREFRLRQLEVAATAFRRLKKPSLPVLLHDEQAIKMIYRSLEGKDVSYLAQLAMLCSLNEVKKFFPSRPANYLGINCRGASVAMLIYLREKINEEPRLQRVHDDSWVFLGFMLRDLDRLPLNQAQDSQLEQVGNPSELEQVVELWGHRESGSISVHYSMPNGTQRYSWNPSRQRADRADPHGAEGLRRYEAWLAHSADT